MKIDCTLYFYVTDSATSSSSETDVTCLHAGVCLSQTSVDAIDSSIAVKAFEIMVFCLCARPELIGKLWIISVSVYVKMDQIFLST